MAARAFKQKKKAKLEAIDLLHRTDERVRFHIDELHGDAEMARVLEYFLPRKHSFSRVRAQWRTGSLILESESKMLAKLSELQLKQWIRVEMHKEIPQQKSREEELQAEEAESRERLLHFRHPAPNEILKELRVNRRQGVKSSEISTRAKDHGCNSFRQFEPTARFELFKRQFQNSQSSLLAGAAVLAGFTGGLSEVLMIGSVVLLNGYISYRSEAHAEDVICSIGKLDSISVNVLRDGKKQMISADDLVVGDVVYLARGAVPADIRLLDCTRLTVDESALSGESLPVQKRAEGIVPAPWNGLNHENMIFRGTQIVAGDALGIVFAVGDQSEIGRIRRMVEDSEDQISPLQKDLDQIHRYALITSGLICAAVLGVGLWRGRRFPNMLKSSIALAVAAVPEGLPTIGTTTMAMNVAGLRRRNVLVRKLKVLETLGSVDVLCLDKTGTLTMNDMIAAEGFFGLSFWSREQILDESTLKSNHGDLLSARTWGLVAALCHDCDVIPDSSPKQWAGSSTEMALLRLAMAVGMDPLSLAEQYPRENSQYRDAGRQYMVTYHKKSEDGPRLVAVKGNPEQVLDLCQWIFDQGEIWEINPDMRERLSEQNRRLAAKGLRVIGFAYAEGSENGSAGQRSLIWAGMVGLKDPMREGMVELIAAFQKAGIQTIMLTGDQAETAQALGETLQIAGHDRSPRSMDASQLQKLSLDEIATITRDVHIFSRVSPSDKLRIVQALQKKGRIVAMTGDGINDSPALKASHVGIAMGFQGTSAARDSADIVLHDDNLGILFEAIEQGRALRSNLRKSIRYLLATNLSEILLMLSSVFSNRAVPLNPLQLLWINLLSDVLPALALATDPAKKGTMNERPKDLHHPLLPPIARWQLLYEAALLSMGAYASQSEKKQQAEKVGSSTAFVSLTLSQILHTLTVSSERQCLFTGAFPRNARLYQTMLLAGGTILAAVISPRFQKLLGNEALNQEEWIKSIMHGVWPILVQEAVKFLQPDEPILYSYSSGG